MSEQTTTGVTVVQALSTAMELIRSVGKDSKNQHQGFNFRGIDAVVNAASPAFRQVGIVVTPHLDSITYETVEVGNKRSLMAAVRVIVTYTFHGPNGDSISATVPGEAMDSGDKATAKAMSVAFRIALLQALAIPTTDPDPDEHTYERSTARPEPKLIGVGNAKSMLVERLTQYKVPEPVEAAASIWADLGDPAGPFDEDALHEILARAEGVKP